ncbi:hypothetical protein Deipr_2375 (plasmid) [Deinococcus proteolyticus MRP]|uniref:Uncharacterized protein n=1 Tax=Deinococcus proteolyticus (strain ATCC 35074 / DSM 20540 / JCM 6276 / NBRC 101906 / NCIMB 13154 / VKM Ac-1939 / CCM 2703 / MRP) TaxID=693977 RepID=F0RQE0_DEIPM|nr:hypothetical protein [Deinococcus proteolyticus]ADY27499.1 hypothetical protein Deipr_2375 [Deinococcus proteolyticus MRP]
MTYHLIKTTKHAFPPVLEFQTPKGNQVAVSALLVASEYEEAENNSGNVTAQATVQTPDGPVIVEGNITELTTTDHALYPDFKTFYPDGVAWTGTSKLRLILTAPQVEMLEAEFARVRQDTEEGQYLKRILQAREDKKAELSAAAQAAADERGVRVLNLPFTGAGELCWAYRLSAEECAAEGYREGLCRACKVPKGETGPGHILLSELKQMNDILRPIWTAAPTLGWFAGSNSTVYQITAEQWDALVAEQNRILRSREEANQAAKQASEAEFQAALAEAQRTGQRQVLREWIGDDDSVEDSSFSRFTTWISPDGTAQTTREPMY